MEERKELIKFNEVEYTYHLGRCEVFADTLNEMYNRLIKTFPEAQIKAHIQEIKSCVGDKGFKDDYLREILINILLELSPINDLEVSPEMKRQLLQVDNLSVEKFLPRTEAAQVMAQKEFVKCVKNIVWYSKNSKFIVPERHKQALQDKFSIYAQGESGLAIYDQIQTIIKEVKELERIGNIDLDMIDLRGLGIQTRNMDEINLIPFQKQN